MVRNKTVKKILASIGVVVVGVPYCFISNSAFAGGYVNENTFKFMFQGDNASEAVSQFQPLCSIKYYLKLTWK